MTANVFGDIGSDLEIVLAKARAGDINAFEQLLFAYEKRIYSYILRLVNQPQDAQDLTQETFLKVYKHLRQVDPTKNFKSWLFTIATHTTYDWLRRRQNRPQTLPLLDSDTDNETNDTIMPYYSVKTDYQDLERALQQLQPIYSSILLLYYKYGFTYEEIARMQEIPINTVKTRLSRAKTSLKNEFTGKESL